MFSEFVATFGLIATIAGAIRYRPSWTAALVGLYIGAAYWFTASTSFANPAVTIARAFSNSFAGIAPHSPPDSSARNWLSVAGLRGVWLAVRARSRRLAKRKRGGWRRPTIIRLAWMGVFGEMYPAVARMRP